MDLVSAVKPGDQALSQVAGLSSFRSNFAYRGKIGLRLEPKSGQSSDRLTVFLPDR